MPDTKLKPMTKDDILRVINAELAQSSSDYDSDTDIDESGGEVRERALEYYLGSPRGDEKAGRSAVVSTDVADAIEWILPIIIKQLIGHGAVIEFDPLSKEDEIQAELETQFTHDVFMKDNEGFLNLYQFVKDALLQRNGIFKIYYEDDNEQTIESYSGVSQIEAQVLLTDPELEVINYQVTESEQGPLYELRCLRTSSRGRVRVDCIPREEFRVKSGHNSLSLKDSPFTAHVTRKTRSELVQAGYDADLIYSVGAGTDDSDRQYRWTEQGQTFQENSVEDESQVLVEVADMYIHIDADGDGVAETMHIVTVGDDNKATELLEMEPLEENCFVSASAIIMSHKFDGLSIYDRLKQIQDQKTALWRNVLDNLYLQNNREKEVVEGQVNMDDLLLSRPGGIKRVKKPGMIRELEVQPIGQEGYQMMEYLDTVRTGRTGVSPDTATQGHFLQNDTAHGVERIMSAKEELTGLMVRSVAEQMKEAYKLIRNLLVRHQNNSTAYKFKGRWMDVNPSQWGERSNMTVNVGTGTGDAQRKQGMLQYIIEKQAAAVSVEGQKLVTEEQLYNSLDDLCKYSGLGSASRYFIDPETPEGQEHAKAIDGGKQQAQQFQMQVEQIMAQAQQKLGEAEMIKGQAQLLAQQAKVETDRSKLALDGYKQQSANEKAILELELKQTQQLAQDYKDGAKLALEYDKLAQAEALRLTELEIEYMKDVSQAYRENKNEANDDTNARADSPA